VTPQSGPLDKYLKEGYEHPTFHGERPEGAPLAMGPGGVHMSKGDTTGWFEMGSTIVLVFEGPQDTQLQIHEGQKLRMGQEIVTTVSAK
jgi:phosphatidylserine decarboxylase